MFANLLPNYSKLIEGLLALLVVSTGILLVYAPTSYVPLKWSVNYAPQLVLVYFALGLVFFIFKMPRLTFTSFACCAGLCLFLKHNSYGAITYHNETGQPAVSVAHFSTANFEGDYAQMIDLIISTEADIISVQELTPDWDYELGVNLEKFYPYRMSIPDLGLNGLAVYSKHEFLDIDTFRFNDIPNIYGTISVDNTSPIHFISSYTQPALTTQDYYEMKAHLNKIAEVSSKFQGQPLITFGDYHAVSWSAEIQSFRANTHLKDSRIGITPSFPHATIDFLEIPIDHIFFSEHFQCTGFYTLSGEVSKHIGIKGNFELQTNYIDDTFSGNVQ